MRTQNSWFIEKEKCTMKAGDTCPKCKVGKLEKATQRTARPRDMNGKDNDLFWYCPKCDWSVPVDETTVRISGLWSGNFH